jgi:hypothetical protein
MARKMKKNMARNVAGGVIELNNVGDVITCLWNKIKECMHGKDSIPPGPG